MNHNYFFLEKKKEVKDLFSKEKFDFCNFLNFENFLDNFPLEKLVDENINKEEKIREYKSGSKFNHVLGYDKLKYMDLYK